MHSKQHLLYEHISLIQSRNHIIFSLNDALKIYAQLGRYVLNNGEARAYITYLTWLMRFK